MTAHAGPDAIDNGLVLALDAADINSYDSTVRGQQTYTSSGEYSWTCPADVTSVSVVCIGGGGAGGARGSQYVNGTPSQGGYGGGLGYKNNIPVTPGQSYTVVVGAGGQPPSNNNSNDNGGPGGDSYFINATTVKGGGGPGGLSGNDSSVGSHQTAAGYVGDGGGNGGRGGRGKTTDSSPQNPSGGGGGAGGYSGNGGDGGDANVSGVFNPGAAGSGGGGGGGSSADFNPGGYRTGSGGGGGVGLLGQGSSGGATSTPNGSGTYGGKGGSGGADASDNPWVSGDLYLPGSDGALYGGGGGGQAISPGARPGAGGAVRIMWGSGRSYPSTNTADATMSIWTDISGKGNNGTINNATFNSDGYFAFGGSGDYISFASASELQFLNRLPYTLEVWTYPTSNPGASTWTGIFNREDSSVGSRDGYNIYLNGGSGTLHLVTERFCTGTATAVEKDYNNSDLLNIWHHVVATYDGTTLRLYRNGVQLNSATSTGNITNTSKTLEIGRRGTGSYFIGRLTGQKIYNKALSVSEIQQNFNASRGRYGI